MTDVAKLVITVGILVTLVGVVLLLVGRVPWLGRLPGDVYVERGNWRFYFPLATSLLVSVVLSLLVWLLGRR
jgi:ribose/xylose/arabinose/galactoside ABC-type transport system permease subunit